MPSELIAADKIIAAGHTAILGGPSVLDDFYLA